MTGYLRTTRSLTYSLLFALPLLLLYELGAASLARESDLALRNGADVLLRTLLAAGGVRGTLQVTGVLIGVALVFILIEQRRTRIRPRLAPFLGMMLESVAYAILFGIVIGGLTQLVLHGVNVRLAIDQGVFGSLGFREGVVLSLGAGIYEELVFRVILVGGIFAVLRGGGLTWRRAAVFSAILAALVFSAFHYIGPYGDPWALQSFLFRFLAGLGFSALFLVRGLGITAWTHALYDIFLLAARGL